MKPFKVLILLSLLGSQLALAQNCYLNIPETTPATRFTTHDDGTVSDNLTGLMWQRCNYGESYNASTQSCDGQATRVNWQQALQASENFRLAGHDDWHVPNIKALASIVEHQCVLPAVNESVFAGAKNDNYWSNTGDLVRQDHAWVYQFADGKNNLKVKTSDLYLRLVRFAK
ncbi:DUF1566 domain-containing protein [Pseudoalteromonas fenneropenaei]|uniref:DUF1566 domain-containing protein n=1 Tax=Pseudoalteromonas fenneropenaei TaxID=1737459 RepID=A0ABV7CLM5_9GAMM